MEKQEEEPYRLVNEALVAQAKEAMLPEDLLQSVSALFKLIGDPTRTRIVLALDQRELCVCDLAHVLGMTKSAVSHQLSAMKKSKIVKSRREGINIFYSLDDQHVTGIIELALTHMNHE